MVEQFKLPTFRVELPSKCIGYGEEIPTTLTLRMLSTSEAKIMIQGSRDFNIMMVNTVKSCLIEDINVNKLYVSDLIYLFIMLRKISLGEEYHVTFRCKACNAANKLVKKIPDDFEVRELAEGSPTEFDTVLPISQYKVTLRRILVSDEELLRKAAVKHPAEKIEDRLAQHIVTIGGEQLEFPVKKRLMKDLPFKDLLYLQKVISDNEFGLQTTSVHECDQCGEHNGVMLSLDENFFRID